MYICPEHQDYQVPLLPTLAFGVKNSGDGMKYWCPFCGFLDVKENLEDEVEETEELKNRYDKYKEFAKEFIHAKGIDHWLFVMYRKERIKPQDLPKEEKDRLKKIVSDWKYGKKME